MQAKRLSIGMVLVVGLVLSGCEEARTSAGSSPIETHAEQSSTSPSPSLLARRSKSWRKERYIAVAEAVERLQAHVDVPVVLPQDKMAGLPNLKGWLADPKYSEWRVKGGVRKGQLRLVKGRRMLILSYGLAHFGGCGGRELAVETNVMGEPALLIQARASLWSQIIWPVTETGSTGRYGITGTFDGWQIVRLAGSMELARLAAVGVSKSC